MKLNCFRENISNIFSRLYHKSADKKAEYCPVSDNLENFEKVTSFIYHGYKYYYPCPIYISIPKNDTISWEEYLVQVIEQLNKLYNWPFNEKFANTTVARKVLLAPVSIGPYTITFNTDINYYIPSPATEEMAKAIIASIAEANNWQKTAID